jgi:hypothetical protein
MSGLKNLLHRLLQGFNLAFRVSAPGFLALLGYPALKFLARSDTQILMPPIRLSLGSLG